MRFWQEAGTTHNLAISPAAATDLADALRVFASHTYVREQDVAAIPVLAAKPQYVIYGPLAEVPIAPDVILLFVQEDRRSDIAPVKAPSIKESLAATEAAG